MKQKVRKDCHSSPEWMENDGKLKEKRSCSDCRYYAECVKGNFGNVPADACEFSDVIHHEAGKEVQE